MSPRSVLAQQRRSPRPPFSPFHGSAQSPAPSSAFSPPPQSSPSVASSSHPPSSFRPEAGPSSGRPPPVSSSAGSAAPGGGHTERIPGGSQRRSYHPNPPAHRSEWVMWAGNVPSDASHDELWRFFNQPPSPGAESLASSGSAGASDGSAASGPAAYQTHESPATGDSSQPPQAPIFGGVSSIFLISRSNCAFINFESAEHLHAAIERFNGMPLRPNDPRCPRLVCRIRAKEDDLKAGVGGQRGAGIHVKWVREQKDREKERQRLARSIVSSQFSVPSSLPGEPPSVSSFSDEEPSSGGRRRYPGRGKPVPHSSSSGSFASTNSSMLQKYFPKRYFILKSLTQFDLDLSVQNGLWATQKHNEGVLDQAYRTSKEVYLIFSVNKSGEFYGYAKMAGPILKGEHQVSWASRSGSDSTRRLASKSQDDSPGSSQAYFSPSEQRFEESPLPFSPDPDAPSSALPGPRRAVGSAPAELGQPHDKLSGSLDVAPSTFDSIRPGAAKAVIRSDIKLDPTAPMRAAKASHSSSWDALGRETLDPVEEGDESSLEPPTEPESEAETKGKEREVGAGRAEDDDAAREEGQAWGESFKVEWIRTDRLPFYRTRHLRNPWNHDREVKVSRDGTELEPSVGQALLDEWDKPDPAQSQPPQSGPSEEKRPAGTKTVSDPIPSASQGPSSSGKGRG
ncbi:hypothetical protein K474DRAFT_1602181 [Panus rudis PR-1116 ss-1]|nr:hypothetical protein K474DRAFT_1602181 [Panus rudis PR-1116 ss-1]